MLYGDGQKDIISQYVTFTKVYQEQAELLGRKIEAVRETNRICKDKGVLEEYLSAHEKEVISIMMALFDQEKAVEQFGYVVVPAFIFHVGRFIPVIMCGN